MPADLRPEETAQPAPVTLTEQRFKHWKDQLLDLSLRNQLLNFRADARGTVPLEVADIAALEDRLALDQVLSLRPRLPDERRDLANPEEELARLKAELERRQIRVPLTEAECLARAVKLDRAARESLAESGTNTLYVALGLLKWFADDAPEAPRLAPLLLVPVKLELDRRGRQVTLRRLGEDTLPNITLAERMSRDFGLDFSGVVALEPDEAGVDVPKLLKAAREAIAPMPRFEVLETASLGLFTFGRFLMWRDLDQNAALLTQNAVVRHIAEGGKRAFAAAAAVSAGDEVPPLPLVVDADSTQASAVAASLAGQSFVLQGPPGTGKSQTITNLIAANLAQGRTVLFVSEKMAALEVVHRRLKEAGLGDFCLELHSNKANKKQVIDALGQAFSRAPLASDDWDKATPALGALRDDLNAYVQALHRPWPLGWSVFQAQARLTALAGVPELKLALPSPLTFAAADFEAMKAAADALAVAAAPVEPPCEHPLSDCQVKGWSAELAERVDAQLAQAKRALSAAVSAGARVAEHLGAPPPLTPADRAALLAVLRPLAEGPCPKAALASDYPALHGRAKAFLMAQAAQQATLTELSQRWERLPAPDEVALLLPRFKRYAYAFFLLALFCLWGARKRLKALAKGRLADNAQLTADLSAMERAQAEAAALNAERQSLTLAVGEDLSGVDRGLALAQALSSWFVGARPLPSRLPTLLGAVDPAATARAAELLEIASRTQAELNAALTALTASLEAPAALELDFEAQGARLMRWEGARQALRPWCHYQQARAQADAVGLMPLTLAHFQGQLPPGGLAAATERAVLTRLVTAARDATPALRDFQALAQEKRVSRFRERDLEHLAVARRHVLARLDQRRPALSGEASASSEPGILLRQTKLQRRHLPLRQLFAQIPNLLPRLKPCFLMSPLSIAQYLPADGRKFDLVVFDEASQIGTHDAIGAIARGEQVIVVGDSKQLPPTTFFSREVGEAGPPDEDDLVEMESILDEAVAAQLPEQRLGWHYRSRHESLIDFSNRHYYDERLSVFPSAMGHVPELGINWCPVNGIYEKGKSRTNPLEAKALVDWLVAELLKTEPGALTFGVVTFSMPQQTLVQDLLDQARAEHPGLEGHFSDDLTEPVFVKNLENVQGDERDVILFSICYGPEADGKVAMNFGPVNRQGGERRLNVAVTRARRRLRVYSSLRPEHIDLSRTNAKGAAHLKAFLQYAAERGAEGGRSPQDEFASDFERHIHDVLVEAGYTVRTRVGCGGYRVDLAVLHPARPGTYALGVECDGAAYASGATARDRDRLRAQVLQGLGWRLYRLWSTAYAYEPEAERAKLLAAVKAAIEEEPAPKAEMAKPEAPLSTATLMADNPIALRAELLQAVESAESRPYEYAALVVPAGDDPERFFQPEGREAALSLLRQLVMCEAPVLAEDAVRRVAALFGQTRQGKRCALEGEMIQNELVRRGEAELRGAFLWRPGQSEHLTTYRGPAADGQTRELDAICAEELAAAILSVLKRGLSLPEEDLLREAARRLGFARLGKKQHEGMARALSVLIQRGVAVQEGERVVYRS